jgi:hypothetical protein
MGDCSIKAISTARAVSYDEVKTTLRIWGLTQSGGLPVHQGRTFLARQDWAKQLPVGEVRGLSVREFCRRYPKGRYLVIVTNHMFAVINGRPMDRSIKHHRRYIKNVWRVTRVPKGKGVSNAHR